MKGFAVYWVAVLVGSQIAHATDFRNDDGLLRLQDCSEARGWLDDDAGTFMVGDAATVLGAAVTCAREDDPDSARWLIARLIDVAPPAEPEWRAYLDALRAHALLEIAEPDLATGLLNRASATLLEGESAVWDIDGAGLAAFILRSLNERVAGELADSEPSRATSHRALAAQLASRRFTQRSDPGRSKDFRNPDGLLVFPNCEAAQAWSASGQDRERDSDRSELIQAARDCADAGESAPARALLERADRLEKRLEDPFDKALSQSIRIRVLIALADWPAASAALIIATDELTASIAATGASSDADFLVFEGLSRAHLRLAGELQNSAPEQALSHLLAAVRLEPESVLHRVQVISVALELARLDVLESMAEQLLGLDLARQGSAYADMAIGSVARVIQHLDEIGQREKATALAQRLKDSGWPEAERTADAYLQHFQMRR